MKDHMRLTAAHERLAAFAGGWQLLGRASAGEDPAALLTYVGPGGMILATRDTGPLPDGLRQAVRASRIGIFERVCPCCGETMVLVSEDVLEAAREGGTAGSVFAQPDSLLSFAILHDPGCPATERNIGRMAGAGLN